MDAKDLRNVALLGHSGSGKTSLGEAALFATKATTRMGNVTDGNTVSDYEPEEVKRGGSIQTTLLAITADGSKINFLDTPGYDDFLGEVVSALRVVEGAVIVVAAPTGVDVGTERSWNMCESAQIPRMFVVNKMDRENASFSRNVSDIQASFGRQCIPFQIPLGDAQEFKGVVSIVSPPADIPAEIADEVAAARERLIEAAAESDDALADRYLSGEELSAEEVISGVRTAVLAGELVPILATSSTPTSIGIDEFLETTRSFLPSPVDGKHTELFKGSEAAEYTPDSASPLTAFVFKTTADPFVGKLSVFRVYQGLIKSNSEIWNSNREQSERIGQLYLPKGKNQENVAAITAGDIGAIGKLSATVTGDTLCARDNSVTSSGLRSCDWTSPHQARTNSDGKNEAARRAFRQRRESTTPTPIRWIAESIWARRLVLMPRMSLAYSLTQNLDDSAEHHRMLGHQFVEGVLFHGEEKCLVDRRNRGNTGLRIERCQLTENGPLPHASDLFIAVVDSYRSACHHIHGGPHLSLDQDGSVGVNPLLPETIGQLRQIGIWNLGKNWNRLQ